MKNINPIPDWAIAAAEEIQYRLTQVYHQSGKRYLGTGGMANIIALCWRASGGKQDNETLPKKR